MVLSKQFRSVLLPFFSLSLLLIVLHGQTSASSGPLLSIHAESAGWVVPEKVYELNGTVTWTGDVEITEIEMTFMAISTTTFEEWPLSGSVTWKSDKSCLPTAPLFCNIWQASLDTTELAPGEYHLKVVGSVLSADLDLTVHDIFGDSPTERCSFDCCACTDGSMCPPCNAGLCKPPPPAFKDGGGGEAARAAIPQRW